MTLITLTPPSHTHGAVSRWQRYEAPTLLLAVLLYAAWAALVNWHDTLPAPLLFLLGGYIGQLHFSLQHEAIHAMRHIPKAVRWALVWPPLNLWLPYPLFHSSHSRHHVNFHLTHPQKDTESIFHSAAAWGTYGALRRSVVLANQTLAFRMVVEPWLRLGKFLGSEIRRLVAGNFSHALIWLAHAMSILPIILYVTKIAGMSLVDYAFYFLYPSMMLGALRSFTEHRWGESPHERVAIVESNALFGLLYLYNNLHHVHHRFPTMPWYEIPGHFRSNRAALLAANGNFYYRGYGQIARRYLLRPIFKPVHPLW
ncbi:fatty acid desaturase [Variovorax fucosicus]|uniref:fatty acid desaturase n=1 Tax=Variovorax fucosicus TaxID=3053517 RepID=UPI0025777947|nr:fatty acid desaturase [Variovorax sp. J22G47]MDM0059070.1 fatty acid desaturase [Variovorax sp. J22G47]